MTDRLVTPHRYLFLLQLARAKGWSDKQLIALTSQMYGVHPATLKADQAEEVILHLIKNGKEVN